MKKVIYLLITLLSVSGISNAQTTAMNFTMNDCDGQMHTLFEELDQNNVVILEFFMVNCSPCISAGNKLKVLHNNLESQFPGHVKSYALGYTNSYTCTQVSDWVTTNNFNSTPFDSGAAQVAYYGGFGMPTIAVVGGSNHDVLFVNVGFSTSDTTAIGTAIRNYFASNPLSVNEFPETNSSFSTFPNPAENELSFSLNLIENSDVTIQLYSLSGQLIKNVFNKKVQAGKLEEKLNTVSLTSGVYILQATVNGSSMQRKFSIVK